MVDENKVKLVVVGSIALDTVATPSAERHDVLGGSVSYACAAASFFTSVGMVGVVGTDFPEPCIKQLESFGIDLSGLQKAAGKTFRWSGRYERDMNTRQTISTDLNVFASFSPELPDVYRESPFLFLANIAPDLQLKVLDQMHSPLFVAADTMDLWIKTAREPLMELISRVHCLLINDSEARALTGEEHLKKAAMRVLSWGPRYVIIKKGEHGAMMFSKKNVFLIPAYPLDEVHDPTGAGDVFAGAMMGYLSHIVSQPVCHGSPIKDEGENSNHLMHPVGAPARRMTQALVRQAMAYGTIVASFAVEAFGLDRLDSVKRKDVDDRLKQLQKMIRLPSIR